VVVAKKLLKKHQQPKQARRLSATINAHNPVRVFFGVRFCAPI